MELGELAARLPEVGAMLDEANVSPVQSVGEGLVVTSMYGAETPSAVHDWTDAARKVSVTVEEASPRLRIRSSRQSVEIGATILGTAPSEATVEGAAIVRRDEAGDARAVVLARPYGVEELLLKRHDREATGYALDLPTGWSLRQPAGFPGLVEIRDGRGRPRLRIVADVAWDGEGRRVPVTARVDGRNVHFEAPADAALPIAIDPEWQDTGSPAKVRARSTATVLQDGKLLVVGGLAGADDVLSDKADILCTTEIYDPLDLSWEAGPSIPGPEGQGCTPLMDHVAVPLVDGTVLIAGGANRATTLGANQPAALATAWRFDPKSRSFTATGPMSAGRVHHTGTRLASGKVLIAGGSDRLTPIGESLSDCPDRDGQRCQRCVGMASAELFDPATGAFTPLAMDTPRACHTATLLGDDSVLLVGGGAEAVDMPRGLVGKATARLSLYREGAIEDLETALSTARFGHVAVHRPDTNQILVAFGRDETYYVKPEHPHGSGSISEVIDVDALLSSNPPATTTPVACADDACPPPRTYASAVLTRSGQALVAGGQEDGGSGNRPTNRVDRFDFDELGYEPTAPQLPSPASKPVLALMPTGKILLVGQTAPAELFDDTALRFVGLDDHPELGRPRSLHTVTALPDGTVLVAGGYAGQDEDGASVRDTAEIFDPTTMTSEVLTAKMALPRSVHTATMLPATNERGPRVLIVGGLVTKPGNLPGFVATETAELYDPVTRTFEPTGSMAQKRAAHAAVRLPTGEVLVTGGFTDATEVLAPSAELYDPATGQFTTIAAPSIGRFDHTATVLASGDVLVAGGFASWAPEADPVSTLASAEIFDHATHTFRPTASMVVPRAFHSATTLADGQVLMAGGTTVSSTGELFDPETETFRLTLGVMTSRRLSHAASTLPSGKILLTGGAVSQYGDDPLADGEIYDPVSESFERLEPTDAGQPRWDHESVLLADGTVALIGGVVDAFSATTTTSIGIVAPEGALVGGGADLLSGPSRAAPGSPYAVSGEALSSYWETSSGPYASPTGAPIAIWVPSSGAPVLGTFAPWSEGEATWTPPSTALAGDGLLFASRHGQSSLGLSVDLGLAPDGVACNADAACESGFCSDGVCCNERCHVAGDDDLACRSCSVAMGAAVDGVCSNVAEDTDPHEDCTQAPECAAKFAVCGGDGECKECRCASKLDCADGYTCTAGGRCEKEAEPETEDEGCAVASPGPGRGAGGSLAVVALLIGAIARRRGRRSIGAADDVIAAGDAHTRRHFTRAGRCVPSKRLRAALCASARRAEAKH